MVQTVFQTGDGQRGCRRDVKTAGDGELVFQPGSVTIHLDGKRSSGQMQLADGKIFRDGEFGAASEPQGCGAEHGLSCGVRTEPGISQGDGSAKSGQRIREGDGACGLDVQCAGTCDVRACAGPNLFHIVNQDAAFVERNSVREQIGSGIPQVKDSLSGFEHCVGSCDVSVQQERAFGVYRAVENDRGGIDLADGAFASKSGSGIKRKGGSRVRHAPRAAENDPVPEFQRTSVYSGFSPEIVVTAGNQMGVRTLIACSAEDDRAGGVVISPIVIRIPVDRERYCVVRS